MQIPKSKIWNDPKPMLQPDGKKLFKFHVDASAGEPEVGNTVAWTGGNCTVTMIEHRTPVGVWVRAER